MSNDLTSEHTSRNSADLTCVQPNERSEGYYNDRDDFEKNSTGQETNDSTSSPFQAPGANAILTPHLRSALQSEQKPEARKRFCSPLLSRVKKVTPAPVQPIYSEYRLSAKPACADVKPISEPEPRSGYAPPAHARDECRPTQLQKSYNGPRRQQSESASTSSRKRPRPPSSSSSHTALGACESSPPMKQNSVYSISIASPPRKRIQKYVAPNVRDRDAYSFEPDPDELWSTLPSRKKPFVPKKEFGMKTSGKFRMPLNLGHDDGKVLRGRSRKTGDQEADADGKKVVRRVVTYLPPSLARPRVIPLDLAPRREEVIYADGRNEEDITPDDDPEDASELTRVEHVHPAYTLRDGLNQRSPTPPQAETYLTLDSSPTVVGFDGEASVKIDGIIERYPQMRAAMTEVSFSICIRLPVNV